MDRLSTPSAHMQFIRTRTAKTKLKDRIALGLFYTKKISWGSRVNKSKLPERYRKVEGPPRPPPGPFKLRDIFKLAMMAFFNNVVNKK